MWFCVHFTQGSCTIQPHHAWIWPITDYLGWKIERESLHQPLQPPKPRHEKTICEVCVGLHDEACSVSRFPWGCLLSFAQFFELLRPLTKSQLVWQCEIKKQRNLLTLLYLGLSIIKFQGAVTRPTRSYFPNISCKNTTKVGNRVLSQRLKLPESFKHVMILVLVTSQHPGSGKSKSPQIKVEIPIKTRPPIWVPGLGTMVPLKTTVIYHKNV